MNNGLTQVVAGAYIQYVDNVPQILLGLKPNGKWEFPGGKVENNESHQVALEREWIEELDLLIECEPKHFGHGINGRYEVWFYEVDILNFETTDEYVNKEHVEVRYFKLDEVDELEMNVVNKAMLNKLTLKYK
jgi:8-oxo-dGTP diphosphatase